MKIIEKASNFPVLNNILIFSVVLYAFLIPIYNGPIVLFLWVLLWFLTGGFIFRFRKIVHSTPAYLFFIFLLFQLCGLTFSEDISAGLSKISKSMLLLLFPVLIIGDKELILKHIKKILLSFVAGNFIAVILCLIIACCNVFKEVVYSDALFSYSSLLSSAKEFFYYKEFSYFMHPSYFAVLTNLAVVSVFFLIKQQYYPVKGIKYLYFFFILAFVAAIYLLSSRAGIITFFIIMIIEIIYYFKPKKILLLFFLLIFIAGTFLVFNQYNSRIKLIYRGLSEFKNEEIHKSQTGYINSSRIRLLIWAYSLEVIEDNFWTGTGTGGARYELVKLYNKYNIENLKKRKQNPHNQFMEIFIELGISGFILMLLIFILPFIIAVKRKNHLLVLFLIIMSINLFFESMWNRQEGLITYAFYFNLFYLMNKREESN